jgi:opacity protein-like surface antigen
MKKIMMIAALMLMSIGAFAQGKFAIGANAGVALYGNEYNPFGIGAKLQYEFVENFRAEAAYNYWFAKKTDILGTEYKSGVMDIDLTLQYLIPVADGLKVYPLAGANLGITHGDFLKEQQSMFGFQAGAGIEYYFTDNVKANLDAKYQYNKKTKDGIELKYDGPVIQVGIAYVF